MNKRSIQSITSRWTRAFGKVLLEATLVATVGAALAFAANQISPQGLNLSRNYFPAGVAMPVPAPRVARGAPGAADTNSTMPSPEQFLAGELKKNGLQTVDRHQVLQLFHDPRFKQGLIVFIDARDASHYQKGHIPGAYEFNPFRPGKYLASVLPVCQRAEQIVVYCLGGGCDDSESAALFFRNVGIANKKIFVYPGGITDWLNHRLPVEAGERDSGNVSDTNP